MLVDTLEERIAKCIAYCRFLQAHGVTWKDESHGNQAVGLVSGEWVVNCLSGLFDGMAQEPYVVSGCACPACEAELERVRNGD